MSEGGASPPGERRWRPGRGCRAMPRSRGGEAGQGAVVLQEEAGWADGGRTEQGGAAQGVLVLCSRR
ncbi:hypothetical protein PR202_ga03544 [Eleusine coracana subsp. coracana]|uniref:Uncharacterized protein n=1 Tax=Eleusine coracana subsp. coracana TaxID=191504 RepID=A0AAV5BNS7_ELECO|nr:hypothetical protein PR202_ga03544 [Eleusine coracana subsp. coracana]